MYIDRTHPAGQRLAPTFALTMASAMIALTVLSAPAMAQSGRLSSNPNDLRDSFAKHPASVNSPSTFAKYVANNPELGQRYARHFGVPQERVVSFFQNALVPHTLSQPQTLTTFGVTDGGRIYPVKTTLPSGTKVWATREGVPVLKWNCSNPLSSILPGSTLTTAPLEVASVPSPILPSGSPVLDVPGTLTAASSELPFPEDSGRLALAPPFPDVDFAFGVPATDVVGSAALPGLGEIIDVGGSSIEQFWPALFVPVIFAATQGGGNGVSVGETPPLLLPEGSGGIPPVGPVVVPESNTLGLLLGGLPVLGLAYRFAARRKK
jgi:hypothetical protein